MKAKGFSLIELLSVMIIITILVSSAYPSYQACLASVRRQKAKVELNRLAARMAEYNSEHGNYLGASLSAFGLNSTDIDYHIQIATLSAQNYTILAIPVGAQSQDSCGTLTLTETGSRTAKTVGCW